MIIEKMLQDEIQAELEEMKGMTVGSEEHKMTAETVAKLCDRAIEIRKFDTEAQAKEKERETELKLRLEQMKKERFIEGCKIGISVAGLVMSPFVFFKGMRESFNFERTGTITTPVGREIMRKFVPNFFKN